MPSSRDSRAVWIYCAKCGKAKAPVGRSVALEMTSGLCRRDACKGYDAEPKPDCRWPGELTCGPGCTKGDADVE